MRRIVRYVGGALAAAAVLLMAPVPASAGGPTSVLLVSPSREYATALYHPDAAYARLHELLGESPVADPNAPNLSGGPGTGAINVTWMIHDVQVWRVDRIFVDAKDGPWVATTVNHDGKLTFDQAGVVVHRASDGKALIELLTALKLVGSPASPQGVLAPAPQSPPTVSQPVANAAADRDVASIDWLWMLLGAAAGAVLVVGVRPLVRRRRPN